MHHADALLQFMYILHIIIHHINYIKQLLTFLNPPTHLLNTCIVHISTPHAFITITYSLASYIHSNASNLAVCTPRHSVKMNQVHVTFINASNLAVVASLPYVHYTSYII